MNIFLFCIILYLPRAIRMCSYVPTEQDKSLRSKLLEICSIIITIMDPQLGDFYRVFVHRLISKLGNNALRSRKDSFLSRSKHSIFGRFNYKRLQPLVSGELLFGVGETFWSFSENLSWASYFPVSAGHLIWSPYHGPVCQFHNLRRGKSQLGCEIPEARNRKGLRWSGKNK